MRFRRYGSGPGLALFVAVSSLTLTSPLLAQEGGVNLSTEASGQAAAAPAAGGGEEQEEPGFEEPQQGAESAEEADSAAPAEDAAPAKPAAAPVDRDEVVAAVGVELLPGSAYPEDRIRGIKGGSLWMTMHGQQWPYMPAVGGRAGLRLGLSGSVWADGSYARIISGLKPQPPNVKRLAMQSRAVLRVTPTYSTPEGWFAQGQAEFVALGDQVTTPGVLGTTDDLYVRVGKWKVFDLTVGRFQGWEIANHYGMGLDLNTLERTGAAIEDQKFKPKPAYGLTYFWDRKDNRAGRYAVHVYLFDLLRLELLGEFGASSSESTNFGQSIRTGFRPSAIVDLGIVKVKGGLELAKTIPQEEEGKLWDIEANGYGVAGQLVLDPYLEAGVSFAQGFEDVTNLQGVYDLASSNTVTSVAGFLNARVIESFLVGGGVLYSKWENLSPNADMASPYYGQHDFDRHFQSFFALQYQPWDNFYVKFVGSYGHYRHYDRSSTPFANKMTGGRLRLMTTF